jgi:hypothetical protein
MSEKRMSLDMDDFNHFAGTVLDETGKFQRHMNARHGPRPENAFVILNVMALVAATQIASANDDERERVREWFDGALTQSIADQIAAAVNDV